MKDAIDGDVRHPLSSNPSIDSTSSQNSPQADSILEIIEDDVGQPVLSGQYCDLKPSAVNSGTDFIVDEVRQPASKGSSTHSTPGQRSLKAGSLTNITDDHIRQPESFRSSASRALGQDPPTRDFSTETLVPVVNQPVCNSPSTDHIPQQANPADESVVEIAVDGATEIINQPSSGGPSNYTTDHILTAKHSVTKIVASIAHQSPNSETSSDHSPSYQHPEQTAMETQTSSGVFDYQPLPEDGPIIGLDEGHPTSDVTSSFHSPGHPPSDPLTVHDHITAESQSSSDGSFSDKSLAGYPWVENIENIESVHEKQRETVITRESNV